MNKETLKEYNIVTGFRYKNVRVDFILLYRRDYELEILLNLRNSTEGVVTEKDREEIENLPIYKKLKHTIEKTQTIVRGYE